MAYFYSHLVEIETVLIKLDELKLSGEQKKHLSSLIDSTIHQEILDLILSQLDGVDKVEFIKMLHQSQTDPKLMEYLDGKIDKIEDQIKITAEKVKTELHEDIKESHHRHG